MPVLGALMGFLFFSGAFAALPAHAGAPLASAPEYSVVLTGYNAVPSQTDADPGTTASGTFSNPQVVAARSRDLASVLPFGSIIEVTAANGSGCGYGVVGGIGYRVIADTMNARFTNAIDILFSTKDNRTLSNGAVKNAATTLGTCAASIRVVGYLDLSHPSALPATQADLVARVEGSHGLALAR